MPNLNVIYQRGNYALQTLTKEISALWGYPKRPYEFVTGYKAADNFTGHNADSNGVVHGVDIFVGPGNLSEAQANVLTSFLRNEGLKGTIPGHPDRLYYIIYRDQIAGDFSNWEWVGAGYGHWDHIHISTCDIFWGDPAPLSSLDYDSTAAWGLSAGSTIPLSTGKVTPLPSFTEMDIEMATPNEVVTALMGHELTLRNGTKATLQTHLVNLFGDTIKRDEVLTAADGKTKARVIDILANLGSDVRAIKTVTDKDKK